MNILVPILQNFFRHSVDRYISRYLVCLMSDLVCLVCDDGGQTTEEVEHQDGGDVECTVLHCTTLYYVLVVDISQPHIHSVLSVSPWCTVSRTV